MLLAMLLLVHAEEPVSREALIDAWPEHPPGGAAHTLESHVWRLRRTLRELDGDGDHFAAAAGGYCAPMRR